MMNLKIQSAKLKGNAKRRGSSGPSAHSALGAWPLRFVLSFELGVAFLSTLTLHAQPTSPNRVLELDGNGSYVELPSTIKQG